MKPQLLTDETGKVVAARYDLPGGHRNIVRRTQTPQNHTRYEPGTHVPVVGMNNGKSILSATDKLLLPSRVYEMYHDMTGHPLSYGWAAKAA